MTTLLGILAAAGQGTQLTANLSLPLASPTPFAFSNTRPICVVLVHGITGIPKPAGFTPAPTTPNPGTHRFARYYWQPEFVRGLMGLVTEDPVSFTNLPEGNQMRPSNWETAVCRDTVASDHLMSATGRPNPAQGFYPFLSVMFTHRDGSRSLAQQSIDTAAQIRRFYTESFGSWPAAKQPQLILLAHSGGGLVSRTICTAPTSLGGGMSGSFPLNTQIPNRIFSFTERDNMNFVRQRTMYVVTLSTPHEGAQIAQVANRIGQYVRFLPGIGETDPHAPILAELSLPNMMAYNRNQLHPSLCRRPDGSAIPIHCIGGRAPGGPEYYANPNQRDFDLNTPDGGIPFLKSQLETVRTDRSNRREYEAYGLMKADYSNKTVWTAAVANGMGAEMLLPAPIGNPSDYSASVLGLTPANNPLLDIVRTVDINLLGGISAPAYIASNIVVGPRLFYLRNNWVPVTQMTPLGISLPTGQYANNGPSVAGDGFIDCDGFVHINSALGAKLGTANTNAFANTTPGGSWYRFYRSAADYHNHGSVTRSEDIGRWVRQNITGCHLANQLFGFVRTDLAAGPRVSTTGTKSVW
ncbi:MAG: hypothetical protein RLZZ505_165 [Verrucomicrobiota bacterium]